MDGLAGLLDGPRARGAFLLRILLDAPWSVRLEDEAPLSVTAVVRGHLWVCPDGEEPTRLEAGDVVVWVGSDHWTHRRRPGHADPDRDPPRPGLHDRGRPSRRRGDEPGGAQLGQQRGRRDRAAHRGLPARGRGHPAPAARAAPHAGPARRRARHPAHRPARRGGRPRRARSGGRARPAARPAADHAAAHLVRAAGVRPAGVVRRAGRSRRRPGAPADAAPPRAPVDRRRPRRPGRRLPGGVRAPVHRRSWASRR